MEVGRMLTSGADVWLNKPIRPHEASGTSGMKPPLHGGLNASILDGWWPESYDGANGWAVGDDRELNDAERRDARDARALLTVLEKEIAPLFWKRDRRGIPRGWVKHMRASPAPCRRPSTPTVTTSRTPTCPPTAPGRPSRPRPSGTRRSQDHAQLGVGQAAGEGGVVPTMVTSASGSMRPRPRHHQEALRK